MAEYTCPGCGTPVQDGLCKRCRKRLRLGSNVEKFLRFDPKNAILPINLLVQNPGEAVRALVAAIQDRLREEADNA